MNPLLHFAIARPDVVAVAATALALTIWKRLPPDARTAVERRYPRLVNLLRFLYSVFPDLVDAYCALRSVATGRAKPVRVQTIRDLRADVDTTPTPQSVEIGRAGNYLPTDPAPPPEDEDTPAQTPAAKGRIR